MVEEKVLYEGRPSSKLFWTYAIGCFFIFVLVFLIFLLEPLLVIFAEGSQSTAWAVVICYILIFLIVVIYLLFLVRTYHYKITDRGIYFSGGILTKKEKFVPFFKVTNVDVIQNFVDQLFGICKLEFQTAGQGASNMPEIVFRGLIDASKPRELTLKELAKLQKK